MAPGYMTNDLPATLRNAVRARTRAVHEELEQRLNIETGHWTLARYGAFLKATLAVVAPTESRIETLLRPHFALSDGRPGPAARLRHDLSTLGVQADTVCTPRLPHITTVADAFGAAYVLEGSRLGGRIIADLLEARLDVDPDQVTYLRPRDFAMGPRWRSFLDSLDAFGRASGPSDWSAVTATAVGMFVAFGESFALEEVA